MNSLSTDALAFLRDAVDAAPGAGIKALVIGNDEARSFSAGADLSTIAAAAESADEDKIRSLIHDGSATMRHLRFAPLPIVGAVRGVALGGGNELALACDRIVVQVDTAIGFPERNVGLFPGWCGTVALLEQTLAAGGTHQEAFDFVASAAPAANAFAARDVHVVRDTDVLLFSPDHVLARAIAEAAALAADYTPRPNTDIPLYDGARPLDAGWPIEGTTENDHAIVAELAKVYTGTGTLNFDELAEREVDLDVPTLLMPANVERTKHMAATRKPLRN